MDRGAWPATVHGVRKELDTTELLNNNIFKLFSVYKEPKQHS